MTQTDHSQLSAYQQLYEMPQLIDAISQGTGSDLALLTTLRKDYPASLVSLAMTLHKLRLSAAQKFSRASQMWFDRQRLEQATSETVALYKAKRFAHAGGDVYDLCCGLGGDALAISQHQPVIAVDLDPLATLMAQWNVNVYGGQQQFQTRVARAEEISAPQHLVHIDPDRRALPGHDRPTLKLEQYHPPLEFLQTLPSRFRGGAIKLGPASNFGGKFPGAEVELISLNGECKEATIWFGELASSSPWRATILPEAATLSGHPLSVLANYSDVQTYVYDPDPAVVRAGLVDVLSGELQVNRLDDSEEYLTSTQHLTTPFASIFEVIEILDFDERALRDYFRHHACHELVIKARHIPIDAEKLRRKILPHKKNSLQNLETVVVIIARVSGKSRSIICKRA